VIDDKKDEIEAQSMEARNIYNSVKKVVDESKKALKTLDRNKISELKSTKAAATGHTLFVYDCVNIILGIPTGWENIQKKLFGDTNLLKKLTGLDLAKLSQTRYNKLKKKMKKESSYEQKVDAWVKESAKYVLGKWVQAVYVCYDQ